MQAETPAGGWFSKCTAPLDPPKKPAERRRLAGGDAGVQWCEPNASSDVRQQVQASWRSGQRLRGAE